MEFINRMSDYLNFFFESSNNVMCNEIIINLNAVYDWLGPCVGNNRVSETVTLNFDLI